MKQNIVVMGGAGYVGSVLCPILAKNGYNVTVVDTFWFWDHPTDYLRAIGNDKIQCIQEDIRDPLLHRVIGDGDIVINLACLSNDPSSDVDYDFTHDVSYNGVMNVIDACMRRNVRRLIQASSSSVYGFQETENVTEEVVPNPLTQYAKIKLEIDHYLKFLQHTDRISFTSLRPATLYGWSPRFRTDLIVNVFTDRAVRGEDIMIHGGEQYRPSLHMIDMCYAYLACLKKLDVCDGEIYNIGHANLQVKAIAQAVKELFPNINVEKQYLLDDRSYRINSDKMFQQLQYRPSMDLRDGIDHLADKIRGNVIDRDREKNIDVIRKVINNEVS